MERFQFQDQFTGRILTSFDKSLPDCNFFKYPVKWYPGSATRELIGLEYKIKLIFM